MNPNLEPLPIDDLVAQYESRLEMFNEVIESLPLTNDRDGAFIQSLHSSFLAYANLTPRQWDAVTNLHYRYRQSEPIYGSFAPILVMFRIAQSHGLKQPKIRLLTDDDIFIQLNFDSDKPSLIEIYRDGWAGHGRRRYAGRIQDGVIYPYSPDRFTNSMKNTLQDLALDPMGVAKAMAAKLSACMYCNQRLSDPVSKEHGYGPICAQHWQLPWGDQTNQPIDLSGLFS